MFSLTNSDSEWSVYQRAFSQSEKTALKSGLQTTKIANYFETAAVLTGNGEQTALNEGRGENQPSDPGHRNSWLYSYFQLLLKEILTAANINRVRALAECTIPERVHTWVWKRQQPPAKPDLEMCTPILDNLEKIV